MRSLLISLLLSIFLCIFIQTAYAQSRFSWELRTGLDFASQSLGDADLKTGYGLDGIIAYRFMPHLSAIAGWGWHNFNSDNSFAGPDTDFEETGYTFGLQYNRSLGFSRYGVMIRGGGIFNHIEAENNDGDLVADTDHGFGWQVEAGLTIPLGNRWLMTPSVRYRSLSREMEINNTQIDTDLTYFNIGVSISRSF